jgi:signal transduction histidine kinase
MRRLAVREPEADYRRRRLAGLIAVLGLLTLLVNGSQWLEHRRLRERLATELGAHLIAVAEVTAAAIDGDMLRRWQDWGIDEDEADELRAYLARVRAARSASNVFLLDPDDPVGRPLLDPTGLMASGEANPVLALDQAALNLAASGISVATGLYTAPGGAFLKTGYAPITADDGEVTAILGVEGSSALFEVLDDVRRTLLAVALASILGVAVLGALLVRISESLARAERDLLRAEALTTVGRMAAGIAHEIRNPLGIIRASAERLKRRHTPAGGGGDPLFDSIPEEVDRLNAILTGYLSFAADRPGELSPIDLVPVLRRTLELAGAELERSAIVVEADYGVGAATILGDAGRLRQVFLNLILNAKQAMPRGGRLRLDLAGAASGREGFRVSIADNGVGIPAGHLSEVWKPFFTSRADGSGLGLAIVRRIMDEHGGTVSIESAEGRGTTVTVVFPAAPPPERSHPLGEPSLPEHSGPPPQSAAQGEWT